MSAVDDRLALPRRRMRHEEALALLQRLANPRGETQSVDIQDAAGRVAAADVSAERPIPAHTNAAVDGYAFAYERYDVARGTRFDVAARAAAGDPRRSVPRGAVRIFTGAVMPEGCDTVAMQEDCEASGAAVFIPPGLARGAHRRLAGEDVAQGARVVAKGQRLRPQDVAALASAGLADVACFTRPAVCFFSTGNEVLPPGAPFAPGAVYDSNGPMLRALFAPLGLPFTHGGILPDDRQAVHEALSAAAANFELVVTTGGASLGEEDHVVAALRAAGALELWQLAVKPGRPMGAGRIGSGLCFALPGNPVAALVCALVYVWPVARMLSGEPWTEPPRLPVKAGFEIASRKAGRREFFRGWLRHGDGEIVACKYGRDGSGLIASLRAAGGLIEIPEHVERIGYGDTVSFIPFSAYGIF